MGLGLSSVKLYTELYHRGFFDNVSSVIETGSQELHLTLADFEDLTSGIKGYSREDFTPWNWPNAPRCPAKKLYKLLGADDYMCFDLDQKHGAVPHDLNLPLEDASLYGRFDLVTDFGCNEHCFNIAETYRTMHRLCRPGGFLVIEQARWITNGYFLFDMGFFEGIAAANNYKILFASYTVALNATTDGGSDLQLHLPVVRELLHALDTSKVQTIGICYVLQKNTEADFQYPYQGQYLSERQGHYGYELEFLPNPPERSYTYLPVYSIDRALASTKGKYLLRHLCGRIARRVRLFK